MLLPTEAGPTREIVTFACLLVPINQINTSTPGPGRRCIYNLLIHSFNYFLGEE